MKFSKNKQELLSFMDKFKLNHNSIETSQKLDFNWIIYEGMSLEMNVNLM
jgi:hypothetical protein